MSDIKCVISLLCKYLNLLVGKELKPEYFKLAKLDSDDVDINETFWTLLESLSLHAVEEKLPGIIFGDHDKVSMVKLYFAFLQYPVLNFYGLTRESKCNRELLLAFGWLLGTCDVLNIIIKSKLKNSIIEKEYSRVSNSLENINTYRIDPSSPINIQVDQILQLNGRINNNFKEIIELFSERNKLTAKVHAASENTCGISKLTVAQVALIKRLSKNEKSNSDQQTLEEVKYIGNVLNTRKQWIQLEYMFYDWMVTVVRNKRKESQRINNKEEIIKSLTLIQSVIKSNGKPKKTQDDSLEDLKKKQDELGVQLKHLLSLIPNCIQI